MTARNSQQELENIVGNFINEDRERLAAIEAREKYTATQVDIQRLEGKVDSRMAELKGHTDKNVSDLKNHIDNSISQAEISSLKRFITLWVVAATVLIPTISAALSNLIPKTP